MYASMVYRLCEYIATINSVSTQVATKDRSSDYFKQLVSLLHEHYRTERSDLADLYARLTDKDGFRFITDDDCFLFVIRDI